MSETCSVVTTRNLRTVPTQCVDECTEYQRVAAVRIMLGREGI